MKRLPHILAISVLAVVCSCTQKPLPKVSGHRGANFIAPENTLSSADSCIKYGIDIMECDVVLSKDSVFYLLHDSLLNRTTNGTGPIKEWLSGDLDTLDAGSWFGPEWAGEPLPRFSALLEKAAASGLELTVDYRTGNFEDLVNLIDSYGMLEHTYFTFSSEDDTWTFRMLFPDIHTLQAYAHNHEEAEQVIDTIHPDIVVMWIDSLKARTVRMCHERGVKVLALVLGLDDKTRQNRKAIRLGVDCIATDKPELLVTKYRKQTLDN